MTDIGLPLAFDPSGRVLYKLELVEVNTPDGPVRLLPGVNQSFTDTSGRRWQGSQLITVEPLELSVQGNAPAGRLILTFIQDPNGPNLVQQVRAQGANYVNGETIVFYVQPLLSEQEFYAPSLAPVQVAQRIMRSIEFTATGPFQRTIGVNFEGPFELRSTSRGYVYNVADHSALIGRSNLSLQFIPTPEIDEQQLFG